MKTEEILAEPKDRQADKLSRALRDLSPLAVDIVDKHGERVPVGTAGYVLRAGQKYYLRILSPFGQTEIVGIHLNNKPEFVDVSPETVQLDEQGRQLRCIPFLVRSELATALRRLGMYVRCDELVVAFQFLPGSGEFAPEYSCPIVVMPRMAILLLAILSSLIAVLLPAFFSELFAEIRQGETNLLTRVAYYFSQYYTWLGLGVGFVVFLVIVAVNLWQLHWRSKELRCDFRDKFQ